MSNVASTGEFREGVQGRLESAAEMLLAGRRGTPIDTLPLELRPHTIEEAYFVQDYMSKALGKICGWKVGGPRPATPLFAPMPVAGLIQSERLPPSFIQRFRGVEAEIAFLLGEDLPKRPSPYTQLEVADAVMSCHPAIELLETAFVDPEIVDRLSFVADLQGNGGFVPGPSFADWRNFDFADESVTLTIGGKPLVNAKASNPGGTDLMRLVTWLANEGAQRSGGLQKGQWITTGNWTGKLQATKGSLVSADFQHAGSVAIQFS